MYISISISVSVSIYIYKNETVWLIFIRNYCESMATPLKLE